MKNHRNMVWTEMIFRMEYPQMKCLLVQFIQPRNADGVNFKSFVSYDLSVFEFREGFPPHNAKGFIDSRLSGQLCTHAISKTLSQKVITYHWDQATIGNGSLFSHKNTQHTALATVTLDCIVLQSIFGLRHLCAKTDIKYRKSVFRNCPKEYPLIFMIDFKIIGHRLSWTTVDGWFTYLFFVILSDACFTLHMNKLNHPINPHRPKCPKIRSANNILMVFVFFEKDEHKVRLITKSKMTNYLFSVPGVVYGLV